MLNDLFDDALDFDPDALRRKYDHERDKRLRADGLAQYIRPEGDFKHYVNDPYAPPPAPRAPVFCDTDALVIGGGFGGVLTAVYLHKAGVRDIRILERAGGWGGVWYWNRYPGVARQSG